MDTYTPHPIDVSDVVLPAALEQLADLLAENVHDVWAAERIAGGWTYGPERNDAKRQTPCLVPYADLSDEERSYDKNTAHETLRLLVKLGYTITPPQGENP